MKELSIEEKAKAYDGNYKAYTELINRLENVKDAIKKQNYGIAMDILCKPYPEFQITTSTELKENKESEDERIMKNIISWLKNIEGQTIPINDYNSAIAWLEKQGEHKQTDWLKSLKDRVQPKQEWSEEDERNLYYWLDNNKSIGNDKYRWLLSLKDRVQPKQEWSEEDKYNHNIILSLLNNECVGSADKRIAIGWLKSLKDKVQPQPKQWWSEEDDIHFDRILKELKEQKQRPINYPYLKDIDSDVDWLKSLKDRYTWKPSDEQIEALEFVIKSLDNMFTAIGYMDNYTKPHLEEILGALKKLKE